MRTLIIAEGGVNHNGSVDIARALIDVAAEVEADYIKFQIFNAEELVTIAAPKARYQVDNTQKAGSQLEMLKELQLSQAEYKVLLSHAAERGVKIFSTGFDIDSLRFLVDCGQELFKVPSGEISNFPYLQEVGSYQKPVILSTGMSTLGDVEAALSVLESAGTKREQITILHCSTQYPAPMSGVNLKAMPTLGRAFGTRFGYSDHTDGAEVSIAAVALGATVIEKHFTLDRKAVGPDHKASLSPEQFKYMVQSIRNIELALGDGVKRPTEVELLNRTAARKSLVAKTPIEQGQAFTLENLGVKRPGNGISPMRLNEVVGMKAKRDFQMDEIIEL